MNNNPDSSKLEILDKLIEGYSTQTIVANKFGLANIIAIITCLANSFTCCSLIKLPFDLGEVANNTYFSIQLIIISILSIGYASAMIHSMRTRKLIQRTIESFEDKMLIICDGKKAVEVTDYVDSTVNPTFNRVAPIGQFLFGLDHFRDDKQKSKSIRLLGIIIYIVMKIFTYAAMYLLPIIGIYKAYKNSFHACTGNGEAMFPLWVLLTTGIVASLCLITIFYLDIILSKENIIRIWKDKVKNETKEEKAPTEQ